MILMDKSAQNDGRKTCWEHPGQDVGQRQRHRQTEYEGGGEEAVGLVAVQTVPTWQLAECVAKHL